MKLEDFIKENKDAFNDEIPCIGHIERFEKRLSNNIFITNRFHNIKRTAISSAAVITLLLGIGYIFYYYTNRQINHIETVQQYSRQTVSHPIAMSNEKIHSLDSIKQETEIKVTTESQTNEILLSRSSLPQTNENINNISINPNYIEKQYINQLEQEINNLKNLIAQMNDETRIYIEQDIEQIRQTSILPESYQILSEEEQINLITQVYTIQIESIQRIQNNCKQITLYQ